MRGSIFNLIDAFAIKLSWGEEGKNRILVWVQGNGRISAIGFFLQGIDIGIRCAFFMRKQLGVNRVVFHCRLNGIFFFWALGTFFNFFVFFSFFINSKRSGIQVQGSFDFSFVLEFLFRDISAIVIHLLKLLLWLLLRGREIRWVSILVCGRNVHIINVHVIYVHVMNVHSCHAHGVRILVGNYFLRHLIQLLRKNWRNWLKRG